ncbi:male sterility domain-containing protein [Aspergillus steynii IBT 23096]|uniref:Fatty acyl-CoA reductase n=1 Tax=Aspergillus steynii IBT 23096 TaxID=1392250 RepID=A0A2I2FWG5_9EURO|nr:male sterility domain-containing protein [Aspergillus steynii IBT 23096]PLB44980.1 male sterility domain-containing protein [Aspergillus steynii IBT 23096]
MMWQFYAGKSVFITGASGFVGTAVAFRLLSQTSISHLFLLCRGGLAHLEERWSRYLPPKYIDCLHDPELVTVIQGDIISPDLGASETELQLVRDHANIVIHAASSINLGHSLKSLANPIIHASQNVAKFALECPELESFVYVSTAYANSFLYPESKNCDPRVEEAIYPLGRGRETNLRHEWMQVQKYGHSMEFGTYNFPWPYGYAKHLAERLVTALFAKSNKSLQLLIVRPSVIGPAQSFPYPGFSVPRSTPTTLLAAGLVLSPSFTMQMSSRSNKPETQSSIDEVPVDVVVDRLLCHLAMGTVGPIHAVTGKRKSFTFRTFWEEAIPLRRIPWVPRKAWLDVDWRSPELNTLARIYVIYAASYDFSDERTIRLSENMGEKEKIGLQLFRAGNGQEVGLASREAEILACAQCIARRTVFGWILWWLFYSSWFPF